MEEDRRIPVSLSVVAILFIIGGISSVLEVGFALTQNRISINFGVLGLFIGPGLLALKPGWRTCALVFVWIGLIGVPLVALFMLGSSQPVNFAVLGQKLGQVSKQVGLTVAVLLFLLALWEYWVLTRPDVRALFGLDSGPSSNAQNEATQQQRDR